MAESVADLRGARLLVLSHRAEAMVAAVCRSRGAVRYNPDAAARRGGVDGTMADLILPGRITYEHYRHFPSDGKRYEILDGELHMTPAPSPRHQYASKRLQRILESYFEAGDYVVFNAPLDVILADDDVVQPDLVVTGRTQISERGVEGAPLLLVEILSPSHIPLDRQVKAARYQIRGVPYFWILDPAARTLECFRLAGGAYHLDASGREHDSVEVPAFDGLTIALAAVWLK
jgi:Uma2 family endonuclease